MCVIKERAREERQLETKARIKEGLTCGLKVMEDAFEALEVGPEGMDIRMHHMTIM